MFFDYQVYCHRKEELDKLPMVLGRNDPQLTKIQHGDNLHLLNYNKEYHADKKYCFETELYSGSLCGVLAISFAIALGCKEIFLLGFDAYCDKNDKTHWFQDEINLSESREEDSRAYFYGVGMRTHEGNKLYNSTLYDKKHSLNNTYKPLLDIGKNVNIYNVSPDSRLDIFPKICYTSFIDNIKKQLNTQDEIRQFIKGKL